MAVKNPDFHLIQNIAVVHLIIFIHHRTAAIKKRNKYTKNDSTINLNQRLAICCHATEMLRICSSSYDYVLPSARTKFEESSFCYSDTSICLEAASVLFT